MIQQVPGFSVQEGDAVRGFGGAAGNVLINGERPSTKSSLSGLLTRIQVASVIRIELITGASATLDMRGQTKVVNVVVREDALTEPVSFDSTIRYTHDGRLTPQLQLSTRRALLGGALNVTGVLNTLNNSGPGGGTYVEGGRVRYNAGGAQTEFAEGITQQEQVVRQMNFEFERDFSLFDLRLNGAWGGIDSDNDRFWEVFTPNAGGPFTGIETNEVRNFQEAIALGGDIERRFGDIDLKLITYNRRERNNNSSRFATFTASGALIVATTSEPQSKAGESILRGQMNWKLSDSHSIEIAAESAYNFIENITGFIRETPTGSTSFFVDGSDTKVEELRSEYQVSDVWTISPSLTIEPGFKFETSTIDQNINYPDDTDVDPLTVRPDRHIQRDFSYPKPSVTATWRIHEGRQLRLSYKQEVAQLSFSDFVSFADFIANQTTTGNDQLVPERTWAFNAELEQQFWKGGVLTLFGAYDQVEDVQDFVPIGAGDGPGNIGDGTRWTLGFRAAVPLDNLGWKGARIDASLSDGGTKVTDPVTGQTREFSDEFKGNWSIAFRQDVPEYKLSFGFRWSDGGSATAYRFNEESRRSRDDADASVFVETSHFLGLKIRLGVDDILPADFSRNRLIYAPNRSGPLSRAERNWSTNGVQPYIRVTGKF